MFQGQGIVKTSVSGAFHDLAKGEASPPPLEPPLKKATLLSMENETKTKRVELLAHPSEHEQWKAETKQRNYKSIGEFIRSAIQYFILGAANVGAKIKSAFTGSTKSRCHYQAVAINRIGNNVNQIARALNTSLANNTPIDVIKADIKLGQILILATEIYHIAQRLDEPDKSRNTEEDLLILDYLYTNKAKRNELLAMIDSGAEEEEDKQ